MTLVDPAHHRSRPVETSPSATATVTRQRPNGERSAERSTNGHAKATGTALTAAHSHTGEITITRRLFRSGESEYLINGKPARLRDIQDLFIGTGLGPESYAIIEQGRIGQILSNKPAGPPRDHRRSRRHQQIQNQEAAGRSEARRREAESVARVRHSRRSRPPGEFAEAAGLQGEALRRTADRDGGASAQVA